MRDFNKELADMEPVLGFNPNLINQGDPEWHMMRLGVVTASKADCLLAKKGTAKRDGYMAELVAQICTGLIPEEINSKALSWGKENEQAARDAYSASTFELVGDIPFIYKDNSMRFGCSPDGMCATHGLELKCPWSTRTYIEFVCAGKIKPEYVKQCQFSMWVTGLDRWDFANFDPRMKSNKLRIVSIERDQKMIERLDDVVNEFTEDMDLMLNTLGVAFGQQWK